MAKKSMDDLLKRRMSAAQQASELEVGNVAYETMFQAKADTATPHFCELPINSLFPFRTADIGFHPYPPEKLRAFSQQLAEQGIYERIIVRPIPNSEQYEILAGHNRTEAWRLTGHSTIPAEVVEADDARAISIAVATNLLRRQDLTIIERGKAYRALLIESNRNGQRNVAYQMIEELARRSDHAFALKTGTLYPLLHSLEEKELIISYEKDEDAARPRRYYHLARKGRALLREKEEEWTEFTAAVDRVLRGGGCLGSA